MNDARQHVLAFDSHYPVHHKPSWRALFSYLDQNKVDGFVFGGDSLNLECISHHTRGKPKLRPGGSLKRDLDGFDATILRQVEARLPRTATKAFLIGNHEAWMQQLWDEQPELEGLISIERYLDLTKRGWSVIPQGGHYKLGSLYVIHGDTIGGGQNPAKKAVTTWGCNLAMGHFHTLQSHTHVSPASLNRRYTATCLPTMGTTAPAYGKGMANTHLNGFALCDVRRGGDFNLYPVVTIGGQFSFGGKTYGKRACRHGA